MRTRGRKERNTEYERGKKINEKSKKKKKKERKENEKKENP